MTGRRCDRCLSGYDNIRQSDPDGCSNLTNIMTSPMPLTSLEQQTSSTTSSSIKTGTSRASTPWLLYITPVYIVVTVVIVVIIAVICVRRRRRGQRNSGTCKIFHLKHNIIFYKVCTVLPRLKLVYPLLSTLVSIKYNFILLADIYLIVSWKTLYCLWTFIS